MCVYCDEVFSDFAAFRKHMEMEHKTFWLPGAFSHLLPEAYLKVDITDLKCRICLRSFETLDEIANHMNECHIHKINLDYEFGLHPFKFTDASKSCVLCGKSFSCIRMLSRHMFSHYTKYVCVDCGKRFSTSGSLAHHTRFVHTLGTCVCRKCKKTFGSKEERRKHQQLSEKCFKYKCSYCPQRFFSYVVKQRHQVEKHGDRGKEKHECPECKLVFKDVKAYYRHFNNVHTGAHFECPICGRIFGNKKDLLRHDAVHSKTRDHHCPICSKSFTRKDYLKQHLSTHIARNKNK